jgi:hypothetical protein
MTNSQLHKIFLSNGYIHDGGGMYSKHVGRCFAMIQINQNGIFPKVHGNGYAESDFISNIDLTESNLRSFLTANSI